MSYISDESLRAFGHVLKHKDSQVATLKAENARLRAALQGRVTVVKKVTKLPVVHIERFGDDAAPRQGLRGTAHFGPDEVNALRREVSQLKAENAQLRAVLQPFARAAAKLDDGLPPDLICDDEYTIGSALHDKDQPIVGELRAARRAFEQSAPDAAGQTGRSDD